MPLLGEWTFNNFCMSMSQQARSAKEDFLELKNSFEEQKCTLKKQQESLQLLQHIITNQHKIVTNQHKTIIEINERLKHDDNNNNYRSVDSTGANSSNAFADDPIFIVTPTQSPTNSSSDSNNEMDQFPSPKKVSLF